ncbi:MAG: low affinity iron permease family protein, partial [bacterium]|nr:low affinity iron permease family protein [bacterium]
VINTGTTIITFLMVFLIQNTQNRDGAALQTKLDELILFSDAEDDFMGIETLTDRELAVLHDRCAGAADKSQRLLERTKGERESRAAKTAPASQPAGKKTPSIKASAKAPARPARSRARSGRGAVKGA